MTFELYSLRFHFVALDPVYFSAGVPGNDLRGALGGIFRKLACTPECTSVSTCERRATCPYARIFEPAATGKGPSGLAEWPRPFVFRAGCLDGVTKQPGEAFQFDLNIFEIRDPAISYFVRSFAQLAGEGLGLHRGRVRLRSVHELDQSGMSTGEIYSSADTAGREPAAPLLFRLDAPAGGIGRIRVQFLTPTELKAAGQVAGRPEFPVLFSRVRDRISTLRALYQGGPLAIDFQAMGRRAAAVEMTRCALAWRKLKRRSSRTGQTHPIGGFIGEAEYAGDLTEFYPYLKLAEWTGVGRHTVWGKGAIRVTQL